jgi:ribosomal protein RSM22 (predicted rRNA methylase)
MMTIGNEAIGNRGARFSAWQWEREIEGQFLSWRSKSGTGLELMRTFAEAVAQTIYKNGDGFAQSGKLASKLSAVLTSCDHLTFDERVEALAYSGLHLVDRYGRVSQVLEYLIRIGRLPLRTAGAFMLEIGAGPAPALYAVRDFYIALSRWPGLKDIDFGPLQICDTLDRGRAWDSLLHHLSENLAIIRGALSDGYLPWERSIHDFTGLHVWERHHRSVARSAAHLVSELHEAGEWVSDASARQMAYEEGVLEPSAYDMVFLCNFLTQQSMTEKFELELRRLAFSLTPGGLLIVIGGTGGSYPAIYSKIRTIAATAKLLDVSPKEVFQANAEPRSLSLIADHVRENVKFALSECPTQVRTAVMESLPKDLVDDNRELKLPKFQALIFVRQGPPRRKKPKT